MCNATALTPVLGFVGCTCNCLDSTTCYSLLLDAPESAAMIILTLRIFAYLSVTLLEDNFFSEVLNSLLPSLSHNSTSAWSSMRSVCLPDCGPVKLPRLTPAMPQMLAVFYTSSGTIVRSYSSVQVCSPCRTPCAMRLLTL